MGENTRQGATGDNPDDVPQANEGKETLRYEDLRFDDSAPTDPARPWETETPTIQAALGLARLANEILSLATLVRDTGGLVAEKVDDLTRAYGDFLAQWRPFCDKLRAICPNPRFVQIAEELDHDIDSLRNLCESAERRAPAPGKYAAIVAFGHSSAWLNAVEATRRFIVRVQELERLNLVAGSTPMPFRRSKGVKRPRTVPRSIDDIPPFDAESGEWVTAREAADIEKIKVASLGTYRTQGHRFGKMAGCDLHGRVWRRVGTETSHPFYLDSTLRRSKQSR